MAALFEVEPTFVSFIAFNNKSQVFVDRPPAPVAPVTVPRRPPQDYVIVDVYDGQMSSGFSHPDDGIARTVVETFVPFMLSGDRCLMKYDEDVEITSNVSMLAHTGTDTPMTHAIDAWSVKVKSSAFKGIVPTKVLILRVKFACEEAIIHAFSYHITVVSPLKYPDFPADTPTTTNLVKLPVGRDMTKGNGFIVPDDNSSPD